MYYPLYPRPLTLRGFSRFEEIVEQHKGKKRPAEKMDTGDKPSLPTKAEKKAAKKQKGENGAVIPKEDSVKDTKEEKKEGKKEKKERLLGRVRTLRVASRLRKSRLGVGRELRRASRSR